MQLQGKRGITLQPQKPAEMQVNCGVARASKIFFSAPELFLRSLI
jgi:hypothetical protein